MNQGPIQDGCTDGKALPDVTIILSDAARQRSMVPLIGDDRLLLKALSAVIGELVHRGIAYSPSSEEQVMLRALLRRAHNRWKVSVGYEGSLDDFVADWLRNGVPISDWIMDDWR